jgi:hypothetical protein
MLTTHRSRVALRILLVFPILLCFALPAACARGPRPGPGYLMADGANEVGIGVTPDDARRLMELSKAWVGRTLRGDAEAGREALQDMGGMLEAGRMFTVPNGTACTVLEVDGELCEVRVEAGPAAGRTGHVQSAFVRT